MIFRKKEEIGDLLWKEENLYNSNYSRFGRDVNPAPFVFDSLKACLGLT